MIFRPLLLTFALSAGAAELPELTEYPVAPAKIDYSTKPIIPEVRESSRCIRGLHYFDATKAPNFAGEFTLFLTGCGTGSAEFCLVNRMTGEVFPGLIVVGGPELEFAQNSRLIVVKHTDGMYGRDNPFYADCYVWEESRLRFLARFRTTLGISKNGAPINWTQEIALDPNPPNWRLK